MKSLKVYFILLLSVTSVGAFAQQQKTDSIAKQEISKLEFLTGKWSGKGWIMGKDRQKHSFEETENVAFKLDSTIVLIEGSGKTGGQITHSALAIVTYNKEEKNYDFRSYLANGQNGVFKGELKGISFYWYPNESMRYIITLNDKNQWSEIGEMKRGDHWFQFFEMTLSKKSNWNHKNSP